MGALWPQVTYRRQMSGTAQRGGSGEIAYPGEWRQDPIYMDGVPIVFIYPTESPSIRRPPLSTPIAWPGLKLMNPTWRNNSFCTGMWWTVRLFSRRKWPVP